MRKILYKIIENEFSVDIIRRMRYHDIYVGNNNQQNGVIENIVSELRNSPHGIFVVGGGTRVGKNRTIEQSLQKLKIPIDREPVRPDIDIFYDDNSKEQLFTWESAYAKGETIFARGEIHIDYDNVFVHISNFYKRSLHDGKGIKILFNVLSREVPIWQDTELENSITRKLQRIFNKGLTFHMLYADREQMLKELWTLRDTGELDDLAARLGFNTGNDIWYSAEETQDFDEFRELLGRLMSEEIGYGTETR